MHIFDIITSPRRFSTPVQNTKLQAMQVPKLLLTQCAALLFLASLFQPSTLFAQSCDCPYPIIFLHGYTGNQDTYTGVWNNSDFINIYGNRADVFHAVLNANLSSTNVFGPDNAEGGGDDDVVFFFNNESNILASGCVYSANWENWWNGEYNNPELLQNICGDTLFEESHSNESAIVKQGYALKQMISAVLDANPGKDKVIVVGHSMGGLEIREYLQRTEGGSPRWWLNPGQPDGHQVIKAVTTATPHRGSNFFGNPWPLQDPRPDNSANNRNGLPDIFAEATRDLRYSYIFNPGNPLNCGILGSCPGPYLFGGDEDYPWGYWNEDVNCDGDEADNNLLGINQAASSGDEWNGTTDNPAMPLPTNLRYTWITSDVGTGGDLVVDILRQVIYDASGPVPSDGTAFRLTDTLLTDVNHLSVDDEIEVVIRGLDEGDYPLFAWDIATDVNYVGIPQVRSIDAPESPNTDDPDWFAVDIPAGTNTFLDIKVEPSANLGGQIDFFATNPGDYTNMTANSTHTLSFAAGSGAQVLSIAPADYVAGSTAYIRVIHQGVGYGSWSQNYCVACCITTILPVEWLSFEATQIDENVLLEWSVASELNNRQYELEHSSNGIAFTNIGTVEGAGTTTDKQHYQFVDDHPRPGSNYYRIRQVDMDGSYKFSTLKEVFFENSELAINAVYPNPVRSRLGISMNAALSGKVSVSVVNTLGQTVLQQSRFLQKGNNDIGLSTASLSTGVYHLLIEQNGVFRQVKFVRY